MFSGTVGSLALGGLKDADGSVADAEAVLALADVLAVVVGLHGADDELQPALVRVEHVGVVEQDVDCVPVTVRYLHQVPGQVHLSQSDSGYNKYSLVICQCYSLKSLIKILSKWIFNAI